MGHSHWTLIYLLLPPHHVTPLHWAAGKGYVDIVQYLIQKEADINIKANDGVSERDCILLAMD